MRYARILSIGLVATVAFAWSAAAIENADEVAGYCQSLERGAKGVALHGGAEGVPGLVRSTANGRRSARPGATADRRLPRRAT
jgi:hypothetical protein